MSVSTSHQVTDSLPAESKRRSAGVAGRGRTPTRELLLNAGMRLFADRGLHKVTTHDIAREAGFAPGTFYLHFKDKQTLFRKLIDDAVGELNRRMDSPATDSTNLCAAVYSRAEALVSFAEEHRELIRILFCPSAEGGQIREEVLENIASRIAAGRREIVAEGRMPANMDPDVIGQALIGMWARVVVWWAADPSRAPRDSVVETLARIQLSGTHPADWDTNIATPGPPLERAGEAGPEQR